ncbi:MAG: phosphotransferase [Bacteroidota bacterium]
MDKELKEASKMFRLGNLDWELIKSQINYIYGSESKILQFTPLEYKLTNEILIELNWIEYLNRNGFEVVEIVKSRKDNLAEEINGYTVICYERIIGEKAGKSSWNNEFFQNLGRFTGKLHRLGKSFEEKNKYNYKNWNEISKGRFVEYLPQDERNLVEVCENLIEEFSSYEINDNNYGLVHYDIHHENYYVIGSSKKIILFDFEMTCRSWYINDISIILYYILNSTPKEEHKKISDLFLISFFEGYRKEFSIEEKEKEKVSKFILYRDLLVYGYTFRIWKEEKNMSDMEIRFRNKLSDSIARRMNDVIL